MIIDCFIFYNELKMLSFRLKELNENVDYFVIVESTHTFSGEKKKLYFEENKHLFKDYLHKIIHVIHKNEYIKPDIHISDFPDGEQWINEFNQRNDIHLGINKLNLNDEDLIIISDVDEIPNISSIKEYIKSTGCLDQILSLDMKLYYYNIENLVTEKWLSSKILPFKIYKKINKPQIIRDPHRNRGDNILNKGGWHFSYFFDIDLIINKIKVFAHQELNKEEYLCKEKIDELIKNNKDIFLREDVKMEKIEIKNNNYLPKNYKMLL